MPIAIGGIPAVGGHHINYKCLILYQPAACSAHGLRRVAAEIFVHCGDVRFWAQLGSARECRAFPVIGDTADIARVYADELVVASQNEDCQVPDCRCVRDEVIKPLKAQCPGSLRQIDGGNPNEPLPFGCRLVEPAGEIPVFDSAGCGPPTRRSNRNLLHLFAAKYEPLTHRPDFLEVG